MGFDVKPWQTARVRKEGCLWKKNEHRGEKSNAQMKGTGRQSQREVFYLRGTQMQNRAGEFKECPLWS